MVIHLEELTIDEKDLMIYQDNPIENFLMIDLICIFIINQKSINQE